ncbi:hypothetical protein T10_1729 [Trichinella papuae]|uniref:Uncharacterized protein n=1 Tax=Trichinella papuae TaxID=268474 RepID=A0A0V1MRK7_9BILA|nr:hypothetical protein T10_1729 [Trichinella papuae]
MNACVFNTTRQFLQKKYLPRAKMPIPNITYPKPADLLKHNLEKMEKTTLYPDVGKIALNGRYQGGFEIAYKRHQIKWDA